VSLFGCAVRYLFLGSSRHGHPPWGSPSDKVMALHDPQFPAQQAIEQSKNGGGLMSTTYSLALLTGIMRISSETRGIQD
jgi:hypothetical protein